MLQHLSSDGPKQLYELAHLKSTREAGTSYLVSKAMYS